MEAADRWKIGVDIIDIILKTIIAGGVAALGFIQHFAAEDARKAEDLAARQREQFNRETACWSATRDSVDLVLKFCIRPEMVTQMAAQLPKTCMATEAQNVADLLSTLASDNSRNCPTQRSRPPAAGTDEEASRPPLPGTPATGWVAVGFQNTTDFNFVTSGEQALRRAPAVGEIIKARWSVNVRPGIARWGSVAYTLGAGECFKVSAVDPNVPAGALLQIWAQGTRTDCP